jgi:site-specific recombinase XerC
MSKPPESTIIPFPSALAFPRGKLEDAAPMIALVGNSSRTAAAVTFTDAKTALAVECPEGKKHWEAWHKLDSYLGVRVASPRKRDGRALRVWIARYKDGSKHTKKVLGRCTHMDYDEAHYQALRCKRIGAARSDDVIVETLEEAYDSYIAVRKTLSEAALADYKKAMAIVKDWKHRKIDSFTPKEMSDRFKKIKKDIQDTPKAKRVGYDGNSTAVSVMRLLRSIFNDAIANHIIRFNPVSGLVRTGALKRTPRKAKPLEFSKLPEFWRWLHHGTCQPVVRDYILIALFTGFRLSVMNDLKWDFYSSRMKTYKLLPETRGNKSKALVPMPLPSLVVEIFERRYKERAPDDIYVLPSVRYQGEPVKSVRGSLKALSKAIGVKVNVHDLRRLSATICLRATNNFLVMKRLLTHNLNAAAEREATASGYPTTEYNELLSAMEAMVKYVFDAVGETYT